MQALRRGTHSGAEKCVEHRAQPGVLAVTQDVMCDFMRQHPSQFVIRANEPSSPPLSHLHVFHLLSH